MITVGGRVIVYKGRSSEEVRRVLRETKTLWVVTTPYGNGELKFKKDGLRLVGDSGYFSTYLKECTQEDLDRLQTRALAEQLVSRIKSNGIELFKNFSAEEIKAILDKLA